MPDEEHYPGKPSFPRFEDPEKRPARKADSKQGGPANQQHRRGFTQPGRTRVQRAEALPARRQIKALLNNPTPSPAEQARLQELTDRKSFRAAVAEAKRILASPVDSETEAPRPAGPDGSAADESRRTADRLRRNPGRR